MTTIIFKVVGGHFNEHLIPSNLWIEQNEEPMTHTEEKKGLYGQAEFNRFGYISAILLIVGCLGGITVGLGAVEHVWSLALIVIPTMLTLALLLAVSPMKYIINAAFVTIAVDILMICYLLLT